MKNKVDDNMLGYFLGYLNLTPENRKIVLSTFKPKSAKAFLAMLDPIEEAMIQAQKQS